VLRPLIDLGSLDRYLRKYDAAGSRRFVLLLPWQLPVVLAALLSLEFTRPAAPASPAGDRQPRGR